MLIAWGVQLEMDSWETSVLARAESNARHGRKWGVAMKTGWCRTEVCWLPEIHVDTPPRISSPRLAALWMLARWSMSLVKLNIVVSTFLIYHDGNTVTPHEIHSVSNPRKLGCFLTVCPGEHQRKKIHALCEGNPSVTDGIPSQRASNAESIS